MVPGKSKVGNRWTSGGERQRERIIGVREGALKRAKNGVGNKWQLERTPENLGIKEDKQMSIKLAMNRFWVVSK